METFQLSSTIVVLCCADWRWEAGWLRPNGDVGRKFFHTKMTENFLKRWHFLKNGCFSNKRPSLFMRGTWCSVPLRWAQGAYCIPSTLPNPLLIKWSLPTWKNFADTFACINARRDSLIPNLLSQDTMVNSTTTAQKQVTIVASARHWRHVDEWPCYSSLLV